MSRLTPRVMDGMSNEGQVVSLPDGQRFRFIWSGLIAKTNDTTIARSRNGTLASDFLCHRCAKNFRRDEPYYNRKGHTANKKSRFYCLDCAILIGFIEPIS